MNKILLFITLFSSLALANVDEEKGKEALTTDQLATVIEPIENKLAALTNELDSVSRKNTLLNQDITSALSAASSTISKIHQSNISFSNQLKKQQEELSSLEYRDVDLSLSMQRDVYPIWVNFFAVFISIAGSIWISVWVTKEVLTKTLRSESQTQITALEENLKAQVQLQKDTNKNNSAQSQAQIASQLAQHLQQLKAQSKLALNEHEENHKLSIDNFRQLWINDFRDNLTEYVKVILTLCHFHRTEKAFFKAYMGLYKSQYRLSEFNEKYSDKIYKINSVIDRIEMIKSKECNNKYISLKIELNDASNNFEIYKDQLVQYQILKTACLTAHTRISLMFKPDIASKEADYNVRNGINEINRIISTREERRFQESDIDIIEKQIEGLKEDTKRMLKGEWDRIQRKDMEIINNETQHNRKV
jgi:hypothetical protein